MVVIEELGQGKERLNWYHLTIDPNSHQFTCTRSSNSSPPIDNHPYPMFVPHVNSTTTTTIDSISTSLSDRNNYGITIPSDSSTLHTNLPMDSTSDTDIRNVVDQEIRITPHDPYTVPISPPSRPNNKETSSMTHDTFYPSPMLCIKPFRTLLPSYLLSDINIDISNVSSQFVEVLLWLVAFEDGSIHIFHHEGYDQLLTKFHVIDKPSKSSKHKNLHYHYYHHYVIIIFYKKIDSNP